MALLTLLSPHFHPPPHISCCRFLPVLPVHLRLNHRPLHMLFQAAGNGVRLCILHTGLFVFLPALLDCYPEEGRHHIGFIYRCSSSLSTAVAGTGKYLTTEWISEWLHYLPSASSIKPGTFWGKGPWFASFQGSGKMPTNHSANICWAAPPICCGHSNEHGSCPHVLFL